MEGSEAYNESSLLPVVRRILPSVHFNASMHSYEEIISNYMVFANIMNKVIVGAYILIFSSLFVEGFIFLKTSKKLLLCV